MRPIPPNPVSVLNQIEQSREIILGELAGASDITFLRASGNIGDHLIYAGVRQLLSDVPYQERNLFNLAGAGGHTALISGSGGWCRPFHTMPGFLRPVEERFERVIILPSSFDTGLDLVRRTLSETKAMVFAREEVSYKQIRGLCRAVLAHDTAFFFDYNPYYRAGRGELIAFRTDEEALSNSVPPGNNDISSSCAGLDHWLWTISRHERILSDRAHVVIAGAMLGKKVCYKPSSYHKVPAIVDYALRGFPVFPISGEPGV